ncbi:unnamed protein product, partial [Didymodactylos carnosus]
PRPLAIYLHDDKSVYSSLFCSEVLSEIFIIDYLATNYLFWPCDVTLDSNYKKLLNLLNNHIGTFISRKVSSVNSEQFPLLICLTFEQGQINVTNIIPGYESKESVFSTLFDSRELFNNRQEIVIYKEVRDCASLCAHLSKNQIDVVGEENNSSNDDFPEYWYPIVGNNTSFRFEVSELTTEYHKILSQFYQTVNSVRLISIDRVERIQNLTWFKEYLTFKYEFDLRLKRETEQRLFHGCNSYGRGFYFSSTAKYSKRYSIPDLNGERFMFICRVLIGNSCLGNSSMTVCPPDYDSTTNGSNIFVTYNNKQIYPEYLITFK